MAAAQKSPHASSPSPDPWRIAGAGIVVRCRLTPKGGRDGLDGIGALADGTAVLLARVRVAPQDGAANAALCALVAQAAGVARSRATLLSGAKARIKEIGIAADDPAGVIAKLAAAVAG
ncbi:MAG: DUF167 domain-containing protein [Hyphomicrobiales bacterium]|nr:DUF167 domain-containing protein [Hyphomicrobiales bacterium]